MNNDPKNLVRYSYNQLAKLNLASRFLFDDWKHLDRLNQHLSPKSRILDVGCGSGIPIDKYLFEKGHQIIGIDLSEEQIKLAQKNLPKAEFVVMDMENITFKPDSFDAIVSFYSIYHLPKFLHFDLLKKYFQILKNGGYLMITMGSYDWEDTLEEYEDIKLFWSHWGRKKNLEILWESGFTLLYEEKHFSGGEEHLIILAQKLIKKKSSVDIKSIKTTY